jgi:hypothetical protein
MKITWASVAWFFWSGTMLVAVCGAGLACLRTRPRGPLIGGAMVLGAVMMFAFVSVVTGLYEIDDYADTKLFWISLLIGFIGLGLFGYGLRRVTSHHL